MGINISQLSNGLYQVKPQGEPARVFYTKKQAEKFLANIENTNLKPLVQDTVQITNNNAGLQPVRTYTKYAQEHGVTYHKPPKSGVVKADEIAAQRIAENAQKQPIQHTRQRYAAGVVDTYSGGTLEELKKVEPLGNRAPELSKPIQKTAPNLTPKSTTTTTTSQIPIDNTVSTRNNMFEWSSNSTTTETAQPKITGTPKKPQIYPHSSGDTYAQMLGKPKAEGIINYQILEGNNTAAQTKTLGESAKETATKLGETVKEGAEKAVEKGKKLAGEAAEHAEGWWNSLKTSIEKNPTKWGLGAAGVALGLWALSSLGGSDKKQNI